MRNLATIVLLTIFLLISSTSVYADRSFNVSISSLDLYSENLYVGDSVYISAQLYVADEGSCRFKAYENVSITWGYDANYFEVGEKCDTLTGSSGTSAPLTVAGTCFLKVKDTTPPGTYNFSAIASGSGLYFIEEQQLAVVEGENPNYTSFEDKEARESAAEQAEVITTEENSDISDDNDTNQEVDENIDNDEGDVRGSEDKFRLDVNSVIVISAISILIAFILLVIVFMFLKRKKRKGISKVSQSQEPRA